MIRNQGLHTDNHPQDQPEGTYRDARNISVIEDINSITNNTGTSLFSQIPHDYTVVGIQSISDNRIVVFLSNESNSIIGLIDNDGNYSELFKSSQLNLSVSAPISTTYKSIVEPVHVGDGQDILSVPLNVEAFNETSSSFKVRWDEVENAEEYEIRITYENSDSTLQTNTELSNETEFTGLDSGTIYDIHVKSKATNYVDSLEGFGQGGTKFEELQLSNENILATGFLATWNDVNASRYEFSIYSPNDELLQRRLSIKNNTQYNVTGLPHEFYGQQHVWTITAHSNNPAIPSTTGEHTFIGQSTIFTSAESNIYITGQTQVELFLTHVDEPQNVHNTDVKALGFTANWDEVIIPDRYNISHYTFQLWDGSTLMFEENTSNSYFEVSGLPIDGFYNNVEYIWTVKATTEGGVESDWSESVSFIGEPSYDLNLAGNVEVSGEVHAETILAHVDEPTNLTNTNVKALGFTANWDAVTVPDGYNISAYIFELYNPSGNKVEGNSGPTTVTQYVVSDLDIYYYGGEYQWRVKAIEEDGQESDWSNWHYFTGEPAYEVSGNGVINISGETTIEIINQ